jgi:hypothetical protein
MAFTQKGEQGLTARLNLRVPQTEHDRIKLDAEVANVSVSEMVRSRYFGRAVIASSDEATIRELRRMGGLLKKVNIDSGFAINAETKEIIESINTYILSLIQKNEQKDEQKA